MKFSILLITLLITVTTFAQDLIIKKDGAEIPCKVIEITETHVKYNQDSTGPLYNLPLTDIFKIKYASGKSDFFGDRKSYNITPATYTYDSLMRLSKSNKTWGTFACVVGPLFITTGAITLAVSQEPLTVAFGTVQIICGVAELIVGPISLSKAKKQRTAAEQYKPTAKIFLPTPTINHANGATGIGLKLKIQF